MVKEAKTRGNAFHPTTPTTHEYIHRDERSTNTVTGIVPKKGEASIILFFSSVFYDAAALSFPRGRGSEGVKGWAPECAGVHFHCIIMCIPSCLRLRAFRMRAVEMCLAKTGRIAQRKIQCSVQFSRRDPCQRLRQGAFPSLPTDFKRNPTGPACGPSCVGKSQGNWGAWRTSRISAIFGKIEILINFKSLNSPQGPLRV